MFLQFPNPETLQLALTSGLVPSEISAAPVNAIIGENGTVGVDLPGKLSSSAKKELAGLGVQVLKELGEGEPVSCLCWPQLLPLRRGPEPVAVTSQTPVLFELPTARLLPALVNEMLRLGNDRQGFRYLDQDNDSPAALLRVLGPPYYTLLQALDRDLQALAPRAYLERAPRVWVEIGYTHPLLDLIKPPPGKLLLCRPPRDWQLLEDAPFRDIYEILEFPLSHGPAQWQDVEQHERLTVPLRLVPGTGSELPELWVLRDQEMEQLENFVRSSGEHLLSRLSFAVAESDGRRCVVLRVRPSKQAPPVLVLEGKPFRPYLKLPNLFLPCGQLLMPPLRREAVRRLLAEDPDQITWLYPNADGGFTAESLPDRAFRPLPEWVEYVLAANRAALEAWMDAAQFDFERFVCKEDKKPERKPRDSEAKDSRPRRKQAALEDVSGKMASFKIKKGERPHEEEIAPLDFAPTLQPSELQKRQQELEERFLQIEGALDAPERQALWPELAWIYAALDNPADAAICWANALWEEHNDAPRWVELWHQTNLRAYAGQPAEQVLNNILALKSPPLTDVRLAVSFVLHSAGRDEPEAALIQRLNRVQTFLQTHEGLLPVRLTWLVGLALHRLTGGDVLALARTRDRILERLFKTGLTIEQDLPAFLRFSGTGFNARFQAFRDWLMKLPQRVRHWLEKVNPTGSTPAPGETLAYADLILAFGFARLGEKELALNLHNRAKKKLASSDDVHACLQEAFSYRIEQALAGSPPAGPLPTDLHEHLEAMERIPRYVVDKLRQYSDILEPHEKIDPYRNWKRYGDDLTRALLALADVYDPNRLEQAVADLFRRFGTKGEEGKHNRARILLHTIELSPRVSQTFALSLLAEVTEACQQLNDLVEQATLLEKALYVAAHFDQPAFVKEFAAHIHGLLQSKKFRKLLKTQPVHNSQPVLDSLMGQCFRGLRKMGLRELIEQFLNWLADAVLEGKSLPEHRKGDPREWSGLLRALLQVASGWFYFGMNEQAKPIIEEARQLLFKGGLERHELRGLANSYIATLAQAPADFALSGIDELFNRLKGVRVIFTTDSHYELSQLKVVEAVVMAIITEDFALGGQARRWLDDDEYLIRKSIHHDLNQALGQG